MGFEDIKEFIKFSLCCVFMLTILIAPCVCLVNLAEKKSCSNYQEISGKPTKHYFLGGCFVSTENGWLNMDQYNSVLIAREGLQSK